MKKKDELRKELKSDIIDEVSAWVHQKILRKLHWTLLCAVILAVFGIEMALNFLFVDHVMLVFDEWLIGISLSAVANEFRYRRKLRKAFPQEVEDGG